MTRHRQQLGIDDRHAAYRMRRARLRTLLTLRDRLPVNAAADFASLSASQPPGSGCEPVQRGGIPTLPCRHLCRH